MVDELKYKNKILFQYVEKGGNLIIQYNTTNNLVTKEIAPYNLELSRDRVTEENAKEYDKRRNPSFTFNK